MSATKQLILSLRLFQNEQKQVNTTKFTYKKKNKNKKTKQELFPSTAHWKWIQIQAHHISFKCRKCTHFSYKINAVCLWPVTRILCIQSHIYTYCNYNQKFSLEKLNLYFMQVDLIILPSCGAPQKKTLTFPFFSLEILSKI